MDLTGIRNELLKKGLKITPQRMVILEALHTLKTHPTADEIKEYIQVNHPNVAAGTVYKILETFVEKGLIRKVKTDRDVMRYDAILENHHHLYCYESDRIEDYFDEGLNELIQEHFRKNNISGFDIQDIKLQIIGKFSSNKTK